MFLNQFTQFSVDPDRQGNSLAQHSYNFEGEKNTLLQADYVHPFKDKNGKFEAGYRGNLRTINTNYIVQQYNPEGTWETLTNFTNKFKYDERIQALYVLTGDRIGKISYEAGLRMESTLIGIETADSLATLSAGRIEKSYTNLLPSLHTNYHINENSSIQLNYSRRINRPRF